MRSLQCPTTQSLSALTHPINEALVTQPKSLNVDPKTPILICSEQKLTVILKFRVVNAMSIDES